jgi:hypothetical protein
MEVSHENDIGLPASWDTGKNVLSTKGFPLTTVLRNYNSHKCVCESPREEHRDIFVFNKSLGSKLFRKEITEMPKGIRVCWNALNLFEDKLPRQITGLTNRLLFKELPTVQDAVNVLYNGTYWCHRVTKGDRILKKHIYMLLSHTKCDLSIPKLGKLPLSPMGVSNLKQILNTIDGMSIAIVLAFPDKSDIQNWNYFDNMVNSMFKNLILDWTVAHEPNFVSYYEKIKTIRGQIKQYVFHETLTASKEVRIPRELSFLRKPVSYLRGKDIITLFRASLLIQTRAGGTPPPHMILKSYQKFKETITSPVRAPEYPERIAKATKVVFDRIARVQNLPFEVALALNRAKISLSDSAELSVPRHDGGKYEAFRQVYRRIQDADVFRVNLHDGSLTSEIIPQEDSNIGERCFHFTLRELKEGKLPDILTVRSEAVVEAGKIRLITVGEIHHNILLHPASHILLDVLKLVPSSASGVGAANHAFEFYKRLNHKNPRATFIFDDADRWILSSDLETATDYANPIITRIILATFLGKYCLGFPPFYTRVIMQLLTAPRLIYDERTRESFTTTRGCLMGDPVTKFVMHMLHLVAAEIAAGYFS